MPKVVVVDLLVLKEVVLLVPKVVVVALLVLKAVVVAWLVLNEVVNEVAVA